MTCTRAWKPIWIVVAAVALVGCGKPKPADEHDHDAHKLAAESHAHGEHGHDHGPEAAHSDESGEHGHDDHPNSIHLSSVAQQALKIQMAPAEVKPLEQTVQVTGQIAQDTEQIAHVHAPEAGTLASILVTLGQRVKAGDPLAVVERSQGRGTVDVPAPRAGVVLGVHSTPGSSVDTLSSLMTIADLSQVWATFDLYEQDVALVQPGQRLEVQSAAYPDRTFAGRSVFISPQVDQHTRTIKVRAQIDNPDEALKLGMFISGTIFIPGGGSALLVPQSALQRIEEAHVVFVQTAPETFEAHPVRLGQESATHAEVLKGLRPGERIVIAGSFHLKAEMLKGSLEADHHH